MKYFGLIMAIVWLFIGLGNTIMVAMEANAATAFSVGCMTFMLFVLYLERFIRDNKLLDYGD